MIFLIALANQPEMPMWFDSADEARSYVESTHQSRATMRRIKTTGELGVKYRYCPHKYPYWRKDGN